MASTISGSSPFSRMKRHALSTSLSVILGGLAFGGLATPAHASWTDELPSTCSQGASVDINDSRIEVGNCLSTAANTPNVRGGFFQVGSGSPVILAPLTTRGNGGVAIIVGGINNAPLATAVIVGECQDANSIMQGCFWRANNPTATPTLLLPLSGLLGLGAQVRTSVSAVNLQGVIGGESINDSGDETPVLWSSAVPTALNAPLTLPLSSVTNCDIADINDAATPSIVGNCPTGSYGPSNGQGKTIAVLWSTPTSGYSPLPVPSGASYCSASEINLNGQILGNCVFLGTGSGTPDTYRAVEWGAGGTGPTVLLTVDGGTSLRNTGVDMNASGQVAINRLTFPGGYILPAFWNPASGNTNAVGIPALPGGARATAGGIADNGTIIICGEVSAGVTQGAVSHAGAAPILVSPIKSGGNDCVLAISKGGGFIVGGSEVGTGEQVDPVEGTTP